MKNANRVGRSTATRGIGSMLNAVVADLEQSGDLPELLKVLETRRPLPRFLEESEKKVTLTPTQARKILRRALELFDDVYVHLPLKRALHAVDPVRRLELLRLRLEREGEAMLAEPLAFHRELTDIFLSVRDRHLLYFLPEPFFGSWAFLGFEIEFAERLGSAKRSQTPPGWPKKFLVSRILLEMAPLLKEEKGFEEGVEVVTWNGMPIRRAVELAAERAGGSNPAARRARGLARLTLRPLGWALPPDEWQVRVGFRQVRGTPDVLSFLTFPWHVVDAPKGAREDEQGNDAIAEPVSYDPEGNSLRSVRQILFFKPTSDLPDRQPIAGGGSLVWDAEHGELPHVFRTGWVVDPADGNGPYRYVRIFTFQTKTKDFVRAFADQVSAVFNQDPKTAERGLILDVRDNSGGKIYAAERALQLLSPHRIARQQFQYRNTPRNLDLGPIFGPTWGAALKRAIETRAVYSRAHPLTPPWDLDKDWQIYHGPIVLIVSAESFSATEIFAAGFQDHELGTILGVDSRTGGGGADVWRFDKLLADLKRVNSRRVVGAIPLRVGSAGRGDPGAAVQMLTPFRRALRVREQSGMPFEDHGVEVRENRHRITAGDLLHRNVDLLRKAADLLAQDEAKCLSLWLTLPKITPLKNGEEDAGKRVEAEITLDPPQPENVSEIQVLANASPRQTLDIQAGDRKIDFKMPPGTKQVGFLELRAVQRKPSRRVLGVWRLQRPFKNSPWISIGEDE